MLDGGIIQRLLEEKWKTFAQNQFLKRLLILFVHLFFLSISVYLRPATENAANREYDEANEQKGELLNDDELGDADAGGSAIDANDDDENAMNITNILRYCSEVCTLIGVLSFVVIQQGDEIKNQGLAAFSKQLVSCIATFHLLNSTNSKFSQYSSSYRLMHRQKQYSSYRIF